MEVIGSTNKLAQLIAEAYVKKMTGKRADQSNLPAITRNKHIANVSTNIITQKENY